MKLTLFFCLAVLLTASPGAALLAQEMNEDESAVWRLEEDYWRYVKGQDIERYLALWDERFVGWPSSRATPAGKANISDWIGPLRANPARLFDYELKREAIRSFGDIVVTHLVASYVFRDAKTGAVVERTPLRITHTWRRTGDRWQIITGMSAPYTAPR